jgi:hypothetical protein
VPPSDELPDVPRSPTGRVPQWVLDEATGRPPADTRWRGAARTPSRRAPRLVRLLAVLSGVVAFLVLAWALGSGALGDITATGGPGNLPEPPEDGVSVPLGEPEPVENPSDSWQPLETWFSEPVRWRSCEPIHYLVNPDGMPEGGQEVLDSAFDRVSRATGLHFVHDGTTDATELQPSTGPGAPPVLVRWNLPAEESEEGHVLGRAGPATVTDTTGRPTYVTGVAGLTVEGAAYDLDTEWGTAQMRAVWLHEIGHLVGLDHVEDPTQLMNPTVSGVYDFADGDLTGLAELGEASC